MEHLKLISNSSSNSLEVKVILLLQAVHLLDRALSFQIGDSAPCEWVVTLLIVQMGGEGSSTTSSLALAFGRHFSVVECDES